MLPFAMHHGTPHELLSQVDCVAPDTGQDLPRRIIENIRRLWKDAKIFYVIFITISICSKLIYDLFSLPWCRYLKS